MNQDTNSVTAHFERWVGDLRELVEGLPRDPFLATPGRSWQRDLVGEIDKTDVWHSVFLVVLSIIPAAIEAYVLPEPQWRSAARVFGAPLQAVISGFLTAILIFMGSHLNQVAKPFPMAYKLMLRIMAVYPILGFLGFFRWGPVASLLLYGMFVIRGVRKSYPIPLANTLVFFGLVYIIFAVFQLQSVLNPPQMTPPPLNGVSGAVLWIRACLPA